MAKQKLAIFINTLEVAGSEKVVALLINHFYQSYDIHLVLLHKLIHYELPLNHITVKTIDGSKRWRYFKILNLLKMPLLAIRLKKYLQQEGIGTCLCVLNRPGFIGCLLKTFNWKGKVLVSIRTHTSSQYPPHTLAGKTGHYLIKRLFNKADLLLPNSLGIEQDLVGNHGITRPCQVIYNPIDLAANRLDMAQPVTDVAFDRFTFIVVGRFEAVKNHALLLQAVQLLKDEHFQVLLIGYGPLEDKLQQAIERLGLREKIIFLGYREANHVARYLTQSNCFVMTSRSEGFPNVLLEALACGLPAISTDCNTGPREILTTQFAPATEKGAIEMGTYGLLVPVDDATALASAMRLILNDPALCSQYASKAAERAACFDISIIMHQYADVFKKYVDGSE